VYAVHTTAHTVHTTPHTVQTTVYTVHTTACMDKTHNITTHIIYKLHHTLRSVHMTTAYQYINEIMII